MIWSPIKALFWVHRLLLSMKNNPQWLYLRQEFSHHKIIADLKLYLQSRKKGRFLVFEASCKSVSRRFFFFIKRRSYDVTVWLWRHSLCQSMKNKLASKLLKKKKKTATCSKEIFYKKCILFWRGKSSVSSSGSSPGWTKLDRLDRNISG